MEEPSDDQFNETYQKWSLQTACSLGRTILYKAYTRGDHSMSDLQEFFNKILAGTVLGLNPHATHRRAATQAK